MNKIIKKLKAWLKASRQIRSGINLDGIFINESDPAYPVALAVLGARRVHGGLTR